MESRIATRYQRGASWFRIGLALSYACAFVSYAVQANALYGPDGIHPVAWYLEQVRPHLGAAPMLELPTLLWISASPVAITVVWSLGLTSALLLLIGLMPMISAGLAWLCYLSLVTPGGPFMSFQWDILLLEAGFLAIWLYPVQLRAVRPSGWIILLLWWLTFRLMFASGMVKLLSGDPQWQTWTAMFVHFETQPLPNPLSYPAHHLPEPVLKSMVGVTFFVELFLPWLIFMGRRVRTFTGVAGIIFMAGIFVTGNYTFFNLLTAALCASLIATPPRLHPAQGPRWPAAVAILVILLSLVPFSRVLPFSPPAWLHGTHQAASRWFLTNGYGLFARMTDTRPEIVLETTTDHRTWRPVHLKYKPGPLDQMPPQIAPHQPRVDWQMWFAALGHPQQNRWLFRMMTLVCDADSPVQQLFQESSHARGQPVAVRARRFNYRFTSVPERRRTGQFWTRRFSDAYGPVIPCRSPAG